MWEGEEENMYGEGKGKKKKKRMIKWIKRKIKDINIKKLK